MKPQFHIVELKKLLLTFFFSSGYSYTPKLLLHFK